MMPHQLRTVYGYQLLNFVLEWPLSYGIPLDILENLGTSPIPSLDTISESLSPSKVFPFGKDSPDCHSPPFFTVDLCVRD